MTVYKGIVIIGGNENAKKNDSLCIRAEFASLLLLLLWCVLPVVISLYDMVAAIAGLRDDNPSYIVHADRHYFPEAVEFYYYCFCVLGVITLLFAITAVLLSCKRIFSKKVIVENPWFGLLLMLLIWSVVCTLTSENAVKAFFGENYLHDGLSSYFIYASIFVCASMIRLERHRRIILRTYCAMVSYLSLLMILQHLIGGKMDYMFPDFHAVVFNQFNHFGYILCMSVIGYLGLLLYDSECSNFVRGIYVLGYSLSVYALLMNDTFGAYLATVVALPVVYCFYVFSKRKVSAVKLIPVFIFLVLSAGSIAGILPFADTLGTNVSIFGIDVANIAIGSDEAAHAGTGRFTLWKDTIQRISEYPVFGVGPEGLYGDNKITNNDSPHCEYLQIAAFLGIPGLIMYMSALITLAVSQFKKIKQLSPMVLAASGVTVVYLFSACFGNPVFNTYPYFWIFLGLTTGVSEDVYPVISLVDADTESIKEKPPAKRMAVLIVIALMIFASLTFAYYRMERKAELHREDADRQLMQAVQMIAKANLVKMKFATNQVFWAKVSDVEVKLIPATKKKPTPYGLGTTLKPIGESEYKDGAKFEYDEGTNYTNKILKVTIEPDKPEEEQIILEWVDSDDQNEE